MKVLLIKPYNRMQYGIVPPIGLGYLATSLRRKGHEVSLLDCVKERVTHSEFGARIKAIEPDVVGMTVYSNNLPDAKQQIDIAKEQDRTIKTIIGGPHPSAVPHEAMDYFENADYAFQGEADKGLPLLLEYISQSAQIKLEDIPGLIYRSNGKSLANPPEMEMNLDALVFPSWDLMKPGEYPEAPIGGFNKDFPVGLLLTSRGCPFRCTFCAPKSIYGNKVRWRSIENIMTEITLLHKEYGVKEIHILDDNFTLKKSFVVSICEKIINSELPLNFNCVNGVRLDCLDEEVLSVMKRAGFYAINVGIESGSQKILNHMKKDLVKEKIKEKLDMINQFGFRVGGLFIVGYPAETIDDIRETIKFAKELKLTRATFSTFLPLPGSEIYDVLKKNGEIDNIDWDKYSYATVPYSPKGISPQEIKGLQRRAFFSFYLRPWVILDLIKDIRSFKHFKYILKRMFDYIFNK